MGKKSKRQRSKPTGAAAAAATTATTASAQQEEMRQKRRLNNHNHEKDSKTVKEEETAENLQFEDPFVDEIMDDDDVVVADEEEEVEEEDMDDDDDGGGGAGGVELVQSWHPLMGTTQPTTEELEMDPTAYKMYHTLTPDWPCLSFDFLMDDLGHARQRFPHSLQVAVGTQAASPGDNHVTIMKLSDLAKLPNNNNKDNEEDILGEEYDKDDDDDDDKSSSSSDDDDDDEDLDPILEHYHVPHYGGVNRLRVMPQQSDILATWSDVGKVYLYNVQGVRSRFATGEGKASTTTTQQQHNPFFTYQGHDGVEGFALDWSKVSRGHLATGDNNGHIHTWIPRPEGGYEVTPAYDSVDKVSVEDLQWSPTEGTVLAAAECGGHVSIYDTRAPHRAMLRHLVSSATTKADVNVISWNHLVSNLLATGGDDGTLSVWDLRQFSSSSNNKEEVTPLARFSCHKTPITSVEWHPTDESMLAVSDDVGAYIYDLSVEEDTASSSQAKNTIVVADIPPQLLFCHSGSQYFKELHWHPQISSCIMTTAYSGFSIFIPSNL